jgi:hypothetical protein
MVRGGLLGAWSAVAPWKVDREENTLTAQAEERDLAQLDTLIAAREKLLIDRMRCSLELREAARGTLAEGVASAWQDFPPGAIWIERGEAGASGTPTAPSTSTCTAASGPV